jgi:HD-like signal output (HDOD) protein
MTPAVPLTPPGTDPLLSNLRNLPLLPVVAQQALALVREENSSMHALAALVEKDATLAASLLKLANSPFYGCGRTISSLDQAIVRLGLRECQNLILAVAMRGLFQQIDPAVRPRCTLLWNHCFLTACLCRRLNLELHCNHRGEEFTGGLLHDLGRILLTVAAPERSAAADPMHFDENADILEQERRLLGTDHCEVGADCAQRNRLPAPAIAAMRYHHRLDECPEHRDVVALVVAADHMANWFQREQLAFSYDVTQNPAYGYLTADWAADKRQALERLAPMLLGETARAATDRARPRDPASFGRIPRPSAAQLAAAAAREGRRLKGDSLLGW